MRRARVRKISPLRPPRGSNPGRACRCGRPAGCLWRGLIAYNEMRRGAARRPARRVAAAPTGATADASRSSAGVHTSTASCAGSWSSILRSASGLACTVSKAPRRSSSPGPRGERARPFDACSASTAMGRPSRSTAGDAPSSFPAVPGPPSDDRRDFLRLVRAVSPSSSTGEGRARRLWRPAAGLSAPAPAGGPASTSGAGITIGGGRHVGGSAASMRSRAASKRRTVAAHRARAPAGSQEASSTAKPAHCTRYSAEAPLPSAPGGARLSQMRAMSASALGPLDDRSDTKATASSRRSLMLPMSLRDLRVHA
mmetsp:Transcript_1200/g.3826  ORF Transcript_1200/g.3826 Transcript_1200/m.3826 type:complete len:312 (-) Transcript_1200:1305-2240(-)